MECGGQRAVCPAANAPGDAAAPPGHRAAAAVDRSSPPRSSPLGVRTNTPPPATAAAPSPTLLETLAFAASAQRLDAVTPAGPRRYSAAVVAAVPASENVGRAATVRLPARAAGIAGLTAANPLDDALSSSKARPLRKTTTTLTSLVARAPCSDHCIISRLVPLLESSEAETVLLHILSGGAAIPTRPLNGTAAWLACKA